MFHDSTHDQKYHDTEEHVNDTELATLDDNPLNSILGLGVLLVIFNLADVLYIRGKAVRERQLKFSIIT